METIVETLLERLDRQAPFSEVCTGALAGALDRVGLDAAVVVIRGPGTFECEGHGLPAERVDAFRAVVRAADGELDDVMAGGGAASVDGADALAELAFDACVAVPFAVPAIDGRGVVLVEADRSDERTDELGAIFEQCGGPLGRCMQIELLGSRVDGLERQQKLMTTVMNTLPDPVLLTDAENNLLLANDRAERLFSADATNSEGRRRAIQMNNLLFTAFRTQATISSKDAVHRELTLVDPTDGSDLVFEVLSDLPAAVSSHGATVSILRDITDLKQAVTELEAEFNRSRAAEHRARQEWERLTVILENVSDPILVTDDKSNIIHMNREAERLFDVPVSSGPESPRRRVVRTNDTHFTGLISDFLLQAFQRREQKLELTDPDTGRSFPVEVVSTKILNERGEPTAIVSILHDLTQVVENERLARELKELNEDLEDRIRSATEELEEHNRQLEWQSRELEKASRMKSEFLANMSHELRTPINALLGYASILREGIYGELSEEQDHALNKIAVAARHLLALINDILDLSKIEAGQMLLHVDECRLPELVEEVSETIEPLVWEKSLEYDVELDDSLPLLYTDGTKLKQILLNLLSNAVKFTSEGGVALRACADESGDRVRITVADTGIGITDEQLEEIFDDFRQADQSATKEYAGTGLGLSITKKLLTLLRGKITVESVYGEGTSFTVGLPVELDESELAEQSHPGPLTSTEQVVRR